MRNKKGGRTQSELDNFEINNLDNNNTLAIPITKILSAKKNTTPEKKNLKICPGLWASNTNHNSSTYQWTPIHIKINLMKLSYLTH